MKQRSSRRPKDLSPTRLKIPKWMLFFDTETTRVPASYTKANGEVVRGAEHRMVLGYYLLVKWDNDKGDYVKVEDGFIEFPPETRKKVIHDRNLLLKEAEKLPERLVNKIIEIASRRELRDNTLHVFAHNIKFDYVAMNYHLLKKKGWTKTDQFFVDGARFVAEWVKKGDFYYTHSGKKKYHYHRILFLDTMNYFKTSVAKLGKTLGVHKLSEELNMDLEKHDFMDYVKLYGWKKLKEYNKRDVEILFQAMRFLIQKIVIPYNARFAYTIAGLAFNIFRNMNKTRIRIHANDWLDKFEEKAYFGGRTEAFYIGSLYRTIHYVDFNSLYPSVMINNNYPVEYMYKVDNPTPEQIRHIWEHYKSGTIVYIADVLVNTEEPKYPVKHNGKLVFPVGRFRGVFCSPELPLDSPDIEKVFRIAVYRAKPIFKDYIGYFYEQRKIAKKNKDEVLNYFYKLLMNSLYGKFGERRIVEVRAPEYDIDDVTYAVIHEDDGTKIRIVDGEAYVEIGKEVAPNALIAIAAFVTSYGRAKLWNAIETAGLENVYYTDSVGGDSMIIIRENGRIKYVPIRELFKNVDYTLGEKEYHIPQNIETLTVKDGKLVWRPIKYIMRHKANKKMYRVWLTNHWYLDVTEDHSLMGYRANYHRKTFELFEVKPTELGKKTKSLITINGIVNPYDAPCNEKLWELVGYLIGDGHWGGQSNSAKYYIGIALGADQNELIEKLLDPLKKEGIIHNYYNKKHKGDFIILSKELVKLMNLFKDGDRDKFIPDFVFNLPLRARRALLRGLFSADGTVMIRNGRPIVRLTTINEKLVDGVRKLLWSVGIANSVFIESNPNKYLDKVSNTYSRHIVIKDVPKFAKEIGFLLQRKQDRIKNYRIHQKKFISSTDMTLQHFIKVEEIDYDDYVYDIEVEDTHVFFANGILVHNTDSLFVNDEGYQRLVDAGLIDEYELGKLKVEGTFDGIVIHAPKDYQLLVKEPTFGMYVPVAEKHKGVPKKARKIDDKTYRTKKILGYREAYKRFGKPTLFQQTYIKELKRKYDKRIVLEDGRTLPLTIYKFDDPMET